MKRTFFVDFDGTITKRDTSEAMVAAFAGEGWQQINELWEKREISTEECANRTFKLFRATLDDLRNLLDTIEIDEGFGSFVNYCKKNSHPVYILSDGYDFCIEYILKKYGFKLPYFANKLVYEKEFRISCTYYNQECGLCGTCKRSLMERLTVPGSQTVYVGDGISDTCPAGYSNLVFAKGKLLEYCLAEGIPALPIASFVDVLEKLS
ncbi:MtnX-like HAD-IB family phosphatase [Desulfotruncus alcoholivorax]|uniref:MtnX-like HAD-IB family phosphatase n=1 Tax=Desulfotruncus alcoholivorax TaxID=265477 RepID=UPI00041F8EA1|nr:MtnX-like HAD-IB family phosphatase [Desulfotruncus alcoholivorax]